jgi:hypothetical protein
MNDHSAAQQLLKYVTRENQKSLFKGIDRSEIANKDDKSLAEWQAEYTPDSPQYILAEHEWQRRLTAQQVGAMKFAAWLSIAGVVIGALLGAFLTYYVSDIFRNKSDNINSNNQINCHNQQGRKLMFHPKLTTAADNTLPLRNS